MNIGFPSFAHSFQPTQVTSSFNRSASPNTAAFSSRSDVLTLDLRTATPGTYQRPVMPVGNTLEARFLTQKGASPVEQLLAKQRLETSPSHSRREFDFERWYSQWSEQNLRGYFEIKRLKTRGFRQPGNSVCIKTPVFLCKRSCPAVGTPLFSSV